MVHHGAMPELPEVETIRRQLDAALPGRRLVGIEASWPKTLEGRGMPAAGANGLRVSEVARRGKVLIIALGDEAALLVHLRMTGQLLLDEGGRLEGPMTRAVIHLDRGALVTSFGKQRTGDVDELVPTLAAGHPGARYTRLLLRSGHGYQGIPLG